MATVGIQSVQASLMIDAITLQHRLRHRSNTAKKIEVMLFVFYGCRWNRDVPSRRTVYPSSVYCHDLEFDRWPLIRCRNSNVGRPLLRYQFDSLRYILSRNSYEFRTLNSAKLHHAIFRRVVKKSSCFQLLLLRHCSDISQGSVATHLRFGGIFIDNVITNFFLADSDSERILKIS